MKIAFVYDAVYPYVIGGAEKRNWEIAKRLARDGHEVSIVGMKYWQGDGGHTVENVKLSGVCRPVPLYDKNGRRSVVEPFYFGFFVFFHLLNNDYDVIDCGNFPYVSCIAAKLALSLKARSKKTRFMITWHEVWGSQYWTSYSRYLGIFGYLLEKITAGLTSFNIANSQFTKERAARILKINPADMFVIPNSIEFDTFKKVEAGAKIDQVIFVGRLIRHKRVDVLLKAFKDIIADKRTARLNGLKLKIIGRGPQKEALVSLAGELGISSRVDFVEVMERPFLKEEIKRSKVFVLPSEREGFGIVLIEAMALGTAVVVNDSENSAARSIINPGIDGLMYKNPDELGPQIARLIIDADFNKKIVEEGIKTAAGYDTDSRIMPKVNDYYLKAR